MSDVLTTEMADGVALLTLNRPDQRNALDDQLLRELPRTLEQLDTDPDVDVIILTGADPAFCAGLDLRELGAGELDYSATAAHRGPVPPLAKPLIGAVNGAAVTGGFELALACDFLIASERARFADTHARIGVMPGWGLTVRLPQAVGVRRARQLSLTGNFLGAYDALAWGLVNEVVDHEALLPRCRQLAADIVSNDQRGVRQMLRTYREVTATTYEEGWRREAELAREWGMEAPDAGEIERRRRDVIERGRSQM